MLLLAPPPRIAAATDEMVTKLLAPPPEDGGGGEGWSSMSFYGVLLTILLFKVFHSFVLKWICVGMAHISLYLGHYHHRHWALYKHVLRGPMCPPDKSPNDKYYCVRRRREQLVEKLTLLIEDDIEKLADPPFTPDESPARDAAAVQRCRTYLLAARKTLEKMRVHEANARHLNYNVRISAVLAMMVAFTGNMPRRIPEYNDVANLAYVALEAMHEEDFAIHMMMNRDRPGIAVKKLYGYRSPEACLTRLVFEMEMRERGLVRDFYEYPSL